MKTPETANDGRIRKWYRSTFGQAAVSAGLLWAALPPCDLWPLAWIAPLWWLLLVRRKEWPGRRPYRALWLVGFLFWLAALHWLRLPHWTTAFGWVALSFYLSFYLPVFVGLSRTAVHTLRVPVVLAAPVVWTGLELLRGHLLTGFTMASLGHTQYRWIDLIQLSDLAGAYGVSFVVMLVAACLARMVPCENRPRAFWPLAPALVVVAAAVLYGQVRNLGCVVKPQASVALIQGSIDAEMKSDPERRAMIFDHYYELSGNALARFDRVDLIIWPETMFRDPLVSYHPSAAKPADFDGSEAEFQLRLKESARIGRTMLAETAKALDTPMLVGVDRHDFGPQEVQSFNSAVFVARDGRLMACYDKMHLVVFGEFVPLARHFPWLHRLTPLRTSLTTGEEPVAFEIRGLRIAPNICYETVIPHRIREQVNTLRARGVEPDVLVNLTNDGWFWGSSELDMHLICGVFRAVECRKPLLIAANTGFSAWIDGSGRIRRQGRRHATDAILAHVGRDPRQSWYLRHGDWLAGICLAACVFLAMVGCWGRLPPRSDATPASVPEPVSSGRKSFGEKQ
ncbi:MAG: apolipoprotein N-acyltransferase [Pirellulales bacterium]|nr:apolipoprotein N-acyltransferase [Pirellulales bacterium]